MRILGEGLWSGGRLHRYLPWAVVVAGGTVAAGVARLGSSSEFERFIGPLPPALTVAATGLLGAGALRVLETRGYWRRPCAARTLRGLAVATVAVLPFAAVAIGVDVAARFPRDTNVAWPEAWLVYPSIIVVAETVFHLLPLAGLTWLSRWRFTGRSVDARVWILILATATVEPLAQVLLGSALQAFVVPHVFVFGVVQLVLLRRYGYLPMLWFRTWYYLLWHILWGETRLGLLFEA